MTWRTTADIDEFEDAAGGFLLADPVRNTVLLTVLASLRVSGADAYGDAPPQFGWYRDCDDTEVHAAFLRTPPMPAIMTDAPEHAARTLVEVLGEGVPGLAGPVDAVRAFAKASQAATGRETKTTGSRLFRLGELCPPEPMPAGRARDAGTADRALLIEWVVAFANEVGDAVPDPARAVDRRLENGRLLLWEVDGTPVSLAGITRAVAGVARVAPVYTPSALRGRGYAAAVTTEISRRAVQEGLVVTLFTDLSNPTSNALYQRLGYRAVGDWAELEFGLPVLR